MVKEVHSLCTIRVTHCSENARICLLEWRVTHCTVMCDTTLRKCTKQFSRMTLHRIQQCVCVTSLWRSVLYQCVTRHSRKCFRTFLEWRVTLCAECMHLIRPTICLKHTLIVHIARSPHHLVGQVGQWWGLSPGGRLTASLCVFGGALSLCGVI
jgi:hypothetical protein